MVAPSCLLETPPDTADLSTGEALLYSAVQLFDDRARATVDGYVFEGSDVPAVLEICRRLDGVPLALELAAARVDMFAVKSLAGRLDDRFAVLTSGRRTALPRHQTLRAAMDWSYDLLPEIEQIVFRRLAVFHGDFTIDAAAAVAADERISTAMFTKVSPILPRSRWSRPISVAMRPIIACSIRRALTLWKS